MAGLLPNGTSGISYFRGIIPAGQSIILEGFDAGLLLCQNASNTYEIAVALLLYNGNSSSIIETNYFIIGGASTVVPYLIRENNETKVCNPLNNNIVVEIRIISL